MTTATLRPNATTDAGLATVTGEATCHAATSDNSDASYVRDSSAETWTVALGTVTLGTGVTKQLRLRSRARSEAGTSSTFAHVYRTSGSKILTLQTGTTTTIATLASSYTAVTLTQADINGLYVTVADTERHYELYVDLVYVTIPVVALNTITDPYTASSIVAVSWVNTLDSDGGGQTHYRVWATDDNDGDAIVYDSGVVASSSTTANVGPLAPGGLFTIHVEVAQTVNGNQHWSAEDSQAGIDITLPTSDIWSIVADNNDATGSIFVEVEWDNTSETPELIEVERTIDNGDSWQPVRFATLQAWDGAALFEIDDYEAPPETDTTYRARATYYLTGLPVQGNWLTMPGTVSWTATACWIKSPTNPALNRTFYTARPMEAQWAEAVGVHDLLGGGRVVIVGPAVMPTASLIVHTPTEADATALKAIFAHSPFVLIQAPPSWQYDVDYCAAVGRSRARLVAKNHVPHTQWPLQLIACNAPADSTAGSL